MENGPSQSKLYSQSIYKRVASSRDLNTALRNGGSGTFVDKQNWRDATKHLKLAQTNGQFVPVIFATDEDINESFDPLFGWAILEATDLENQEYTIKNLRKFPTPISRHRLRKEDKGAGTRIGVMRSTHGRIYNIIPTPYDLLGNLPADAPATAMTTVQPPLQAQMPQLFSEFVTEAIEGIRTEAKHMVSSRDRGLRDTVFANAKGVCAVCGRNFSRLLAGRGIRMLQVHHREQLSAFEMPTVTTAEDLVVVCANCHCLLHLNPKQALKVEELKEMLASENYP